MRGIFTAFRVHDLIRSIHIVSMYACILGFLLILEGFNIGLLVLFNIVLPPISHSFCDRINLETVARVRMLPCILRRRSGLNFEK